MKAAIFAQEGPTAGALLRTTFTLTRQSFGPLVLICIVGMSPFLLAMIGVAGIGTQPVLAGLFLMVGVLGAIIGIPVSYGAIMVAVYQAAMERPVDVGHCLRVGLRRLPRMVLVLILYLFAMLLGFLLFVIPGIIACYMFMLAMPVVMLEDKGPIEAMKRSRQLTEGFRLSSFGALFVLSLITVPFALIGGLLVQQIAIYVVYSTAVSLASWLLSFVMVGVYYFGVRSFKESLGVDEVAAVFD